MKFSLTINGQEHTLEVVRQNGLRCRLDGEAFEAEMVEVQPGVYSLLLGGKSFQARVALSADGLGNASSRAGHYSVQIDGTRYVISVHDPRRRLRDRTRLALEGKQSVTAPMPGKVVRVLVSEGQAVESGQGLIVVEAMKMQNEMKSHASGSVRKILVKEGQRVNAGDTLLVVE